MGQSLWVTSVLLFAALGGSAPANDAVKIEGKWKVASVETATSSRTTSKESPGRRRSPASRSPGPCSASGRERNRRRRRVVAAPVVEGRDRREPGEAGEVLPHAAWTRPE